MNKLAQLLVDLAPEVGEWSQRNFPNGQLDDPAVGVMEEFGELCHASLKKRQGIRGTAAEHDADAEDALHDMCIFLFDFIYRAQHHQGGGAAFNPNSDVIADILGFLNDQGLASLRAMADLQMLLLAEPGMSERVLLHGLGVAVGHLAFAVDKFISTTWLDLPLIESLAEDYAVAVTDILFAADTYANIVLGKDLDQGVRATWAKVKHRDWLANPTTAHLVADSQGATATVEATAGA